jgi:hypothetical protein
VANCLLCGVAGSEQTGHRSNSTGNYHVQCAHYAYQLAEATKAPYPDAVKMIQRSIDKLVAKRNGTPTDFP